jgi:hypothetical protein
MQAQEGWVKLFKRDAGCRGSGIPGALALGS